MLYALLSWFSNCTEKLIQSWTYTLWYLCINGFIYFLSLSIFSCRFFSAWRQLGSRIWGVRHELIRRWSGNGPQQEKIRCVLYITCGWSSRWFPSREWNKFNIKKVLLSICTLFRKKQWWKEEKPIGAQAVHGPDGPGAFNDDFGPKFH